MNKDVDSFYEGLIKANIESLKESTTGYATRMQKRLFEAEKKICALEDEIKSLKSSKDSLDEVHDRANNKKIPFKDVPIGAVFTLISPNVSFVKLAEPCVGVAVRDIPKMSPNALRLDNSHYITLSENACCTVTKRLEDY